MLPSCPFCHLSLPVSELQWHTNIHLDEDELARDMELAQQIALASPSPERTDKQIDYMDPADLFPQNIGHSSHTNFDGNEANYSETFDEEKIFSLVGIQIKSTVYPVEGGLMTLLRRCLELENRNFRSAISGYIDHYQSLLSEDSGWGCGWRNIQMMSSHLLMLRKEARDVLFGGSGFVPDIPSLQKWLEIAWERGFDIPGSNSFRQKIYGSRRWIGTTECATILRSFGLRARIVDFDSIPSSSSSTSYAAPEDELSGGKRIRKDVYGPMDKFLYQRKHDDFQVKLSSNESGHECHEFPSHVKNHNSVSSHDNLNKCKGKSADHQILVDWVWNYFTQEAGGKLDSIHNVLISEKTPLYFQHNGHSRTIVGIQKQPGKGRSADRYSLLVLDPGQRTVDLERCLKNNNGWQKLVKRGVHTLRKPQYQLCYVDPGIADGYELEQLKMIDSIYVKL